MAKSEPSRALVQVGVPAFVVLVFVILGLAGRLVTVKPLGFTTPSTTVFDKVKYVDSIWDSRVIPTVEQKAIPLEQLVPALREDPQAAVQKYGNDVGGAYSFLVRFTGEAAAVDTSSLTGTLTVNVTIEGQAIPVAVQIGPIILGTALRDALGFITFEEFTNQVQYGGVADELNSRAIRVALAGIDLKSLTGKRVSVEGAFTYDGSDAANVLVTPVIVKVGT